MFGRESSHSQRLQRRSFVPVYSPLVTVKLKADRWSQCFERRHAEGRKGRVGDGRFCQLSLRRFARGCSPKVRAGNEILMYAPIQRGDILRFKTTYNANPERRRKSAVAYRMNCKTCFKAGELPDYLMHWLNSVCMALFLPWSVSMSCVLIFDI